MNIRGCAMSRRCGYPKPFASERTKFRWRVRHCIPTVDDLKRIKYKFESGFKIEMK